MDQYIDFSTVTACGECCTGCRKKQDGSCPGCIDAAGYVPEWAQSGRCKVHACTRAHQAAFCGVCDQFPCERIHSLMPWKQDVVEKMQALADRFRQAQE